MREVGVRADPLPMLLEDLPQTISDRELKWAADQWLGQSVQIRPGGPGPLFQSNLDPALPTVLRYLEKPRKPDQLERAVGNRRVVRLTLRLLELLGRLEGHPMGKAIPIPKATLLKGQGFSGYATGSLPPTEDTPTAPPAPEPRGEPEAPIDPEMKALFDEVRSRHQKMGEQSHFEVLGLNQDAKSADVRQAFTALAQRLHPDKLGSRVPEEVATIARELFARMNEANRVLGSDDARREYLAMLGDDRIRGDARRAELVRDAETKAQMGVVLLRKREFQKAREMFGYCVEADPITSTYKAHLAFAMYADRSFNRDEAFEKGYALLLQALEGAGSSDGMVHYYTGLLLKERNRNKEALHHFQEASRIAPKNVEYKREVRLVEGRLSKEQKDDDKKHPTGGLGRFFKR
jgi:curved DNA-binding protein CbpA